jgi:DNA-binding response OmpR family regulator
MATHRLVAIEAGFQERVVKPVEPAILAETLAHLVRRADHIGH